MFEAQQPLFVEHIEPLLAAESLDERNFHLISDFLDVLGPFAVFRTSLKMVNFGQKIEFFTLRSCRDFILSILCLRFLISSSLLAEAFFSAAVGSASSS